MYVNIYTCEDDLCDTVHLAMVMAKEMALVMCATTLCLQITQYENVVRLKAIASNSG